MRPRGSKWPWRSLRLAGTPTYLEKVKLKVANVMWENLELSHHIVSLQHGLTQTFKTIDCLRWRALGQGIRLYSMARCLSPLASLICAVSKSANALPSIGALSSPAFS